MLLGAVAMLLEVHTKTLMIVCGGFTAKLK
jgi:hypothetical protein